MKSSGLFRLGRDAELRALGDGTPVLNIALAFNYGRKGEDGKRPTQWIEAALFGERATILAPFLLKGAQHVFHLHDIHIETYERTDGYEGFKLVGRVDDIELTDKRQEPAAQPAPRAAAPAATRPAPRPAAAPAPRPTAPPAGSGFDDMDDDIPF